ncbi:hypothetical protein CIHG_01116 [Coccidioides immitis H538.4]|uniref:Uncharacterized protein n=3 Tax=Coccidioides immitis TaxID=5501 RepID=A0A0J8QRT1_COCIT|nr:hypothetical protein CIRG_03514 [Coccidioides immitis RMSCC 2394]KMU74800.1 hypothetical protein CISG_00730 [Coccidioides immitis RMSCC 3703]KMU83334.1 hypothetical protein CIHG_01116 [Coccidioides immitis H538.4]
MPDSSTSETSLSPRCMCDHTVASGGFFDNAANQVTVLPTGAQNPRGRLCIRSGFIPNTVSIGPSAPGPKSPFFEHHSDTIFSLKEEKEETQRTVNRIHVESGPLHDALGITRAITTITQHESTFLSVQGTAV